MSLNDNNITTVYSPMHVNSLVLKSCFFHDERQSLFKVSFYFIQFVALKNPKKVS